jgi:hypothetical protein
MFPHLMAPCLVVDAKASFAQIGAKLAKFPGHLPHLHGQGYGAAAAQAQRR